VGRKSAGETIAKLLVALVEERTVKQADLARRCGVEPRVIRKHMLDLAEAMPEIERDDEHPHVLYSVPPGWFPDGKHIPGSRSTSTRCGRSSRGSSPASRPAVMSPHQHRFSPLTRRHFDRTGRQCSASETRCVDRGTSRV
jgi:hypothetical protein